MDLESINNLPVWGLFAVVVVKIALDWVAARDDKRTRGPESTPETIAAVIRNQQERAEILEGMRSSNATQASLAEALEHMAATQETIAAVQDMQTELLREQGERLSRIETQLRPPMDAETVRRLGGNRG